MAITRLEVSNPDYSEANTTLLTIHSSHIDGRQDVSVYPSTAANSNVPIVVLLHGVYGSNWVWMHLGGAHRVYDELKAQGLGDFVLVMPSDGGLWDGSGYLPLKQHGDYESWIVEDVVSAVINNVGCVSQESNIYISGLSMGGYGALRLGAKYPQMFAGISAHSSVTNLDDLQQFIANPVSDYQCVDAHESDIMHWAKRNVDKLPPMRLDCGSDDSLYQSNLALIKQFDEAGVTYQFDSFSGGHEWSYWNEHLAKTLTFFDEIEKAY